MRAKSNRGAIPAASARTAIAAGTTRAAGVLRSLAALLGPGDSARQSLIALATNSLTSLLAGLFLGAITGTFERLPGLLVLVPAAIGLRGNIFSTFGNRLSTAIHTGQFELTWRRDSVLMQNAAASMVLTLALSVALAVLAKIVIAAVGIENSVSLLGLVLISVMGGVLASVVVLAASVALAGGAVRFGWDLDNVVAPVVSTLGDVLTLPALWAAAMLLGIPLVTPIAGTLLGLGALVLFGFAVFSPQPLLRQITRESWPILVVAAALSTLAGLVLQQRIETLAAFPALLILQPAFVSSAGALGGILSSRLSSKLHLGLLAPTSIPGRDARFDGTSVLLLGLIIYALNGLGAHLFAATTGLDSPGVFTLLGISLVAGVASVLFVLVIAYYGTIAAVALRVDPDTYGVPVVTSSVDFVGTVALVAVAAAFGLTGG